tara:strand:+ start:1420 stop:2310 length:891 start_codon:yes stop_codon:yes gene_type:complete
MAIKHLANLDLNNNEIKNVRIDVQGSDPSSNLVEGKIIYNSATGVKEMKFYDGNAWVGMKNTTGTDVDVSKANLLTRLASFTGDDTVNIGDADDDTTVVIRGNLQVDGTTTTVNSATLSVADNIIVLNKDVTGSPSENAGLEVERGSATNVKFRWNETTDKWQFTEDGTTFYNLVNVQDASETVKGIVELATTTEATTGTDTARAVTPAGLAAHNAARSFAVNLEASNSAVTKSTNTYTVTHGLATRDVVAQVYETASPYETVQVDIARATTGTITVAFADTVTDGAYRVLITKID